MAMAKSSLTTKRAKVLVTGFQVGSAWDVAGFSREEAFVLELGFQLSKAVKERRTSANMTQQDLARTMKTSQARVAAMENNGIGVSLEFLLKAMLVLDTSKEDIAGILMGIPFSEGT